MDKDYARFCIIYDNANEFEAMELACDEAYELAGEVADMFFKWLEEDDNDDMEFSEYDLLHKFLTDVSFTGVWLAMHPEDGKDEIEIWQAIHELSDIRAGYNLFDEDEEKKYRSCSLAIKALRDSLSMK